MILSRSIDNFPVFNYPYRKSTWKKLLGLLLRYNVKYVQYNILSVNETLPHVNGTRQTSRDAIVFNIFHNEQPVEAVVVGSKITLSFIPYYPISCTFFFVQFGFIFKMKSKLIMGELRKWKKEFSYHLN